jgi:uncharacterized protein
MTDHLHAPSSETPNNESRRDWLTSACIACLATGVPQTKRAPALAKIINRHDWVKRLVNGSDYPLPGVMPLFSVDAMVERGWLIKNEGDVIKQIREYNPILFDFVLKRTLRIDGKRLANEIFESARVFERVTNIT